MNTFDRIELLRKEQKKTQVDLTNFLGIPKAHYTDWKSDRTQSYRKHLSKIADYFGVSVDYLLGKEEQPATPSRTAHSITLRGRDGSIVESDLTDEQVELVKRMIEQFNGNKQ